MKASFFDTLLNGLVTAYGPNVMPIFLTDNVYESDDGTFSTCCTLGYHDSEGAADRHRPHLDLRRVHPVRHLRRQCHPGRSGASHEVAEWINDPFVGAFPGGINLIPPAKLPGQGGACIINFETGDPLEAPPVVFTKVTNGTTYHLQDEVFLSWYMHGTSFSVNGFYTYLSTFPTFSSLCGPG